MGEEVLSCPPPLGSPFLSLVLTSNRSCLSTRPNPPLRGQPRWHLPVTYFLQVLQLLATGWAEAGRLWSGGWGSGQGRGHREWVPGQNSRQHPSHPLPTLPHAQSG